MTRAAESRLMEKTRRGEIITPEDHVTTIDNADELEAFRKQALKAERMTPELQTAIYRRQIKLGAATHG